MQERQGEEVGSLRAVKLDGQNGQETYVYIYIYIYIIEVAYGKVPLQARGETRI